MPNDKWVERWAIRSSSGHGDYIVGKDAQGNFGCSCMGWTGHLYCAECGGSVKKDHYCAMCGRTIEPIRHDCTHIYEVKAGRGRTIAEGILDRMLGR